MKLLKVVVSDNFQLCQNFKVIANNQYFASTNDQGAAMLVVPQKLLKGTVNITISKPELNINQSFRFTEASFANCELEIIVKDPSVKERFKAKTNDADQEFSQIEDDIDLMDNNLEQIYQRLKQYLKQHPGHVATEYLESIEGYQKMINTLRSNVKIIRKRLNEMKNDPSRKIPEAYLIDLTYAEKQRMEILKLVNQIQEVTVDYTINTTSNGLDAVEKEIPVFFQSGEFSIPQLDEINRKSLLDLPRVINAYFEQRKAELNGVSLDYFIRVVGFCDGAPVSFGLDQKIQPLCISAVYAPHILYPAQDGNNCLSWLRAQSIFNFLKGKFPTGVLEKSLGYGSQGATPDISDATKRRVVISYLATKHIMVTPPPPVQEAGFPRIQKPVISDK